LKKKFLLPGVVVGRGALGLDADDADGGFDVLGGKGNAADESGVADRHIEDVHTRELFENFAGQGGRAGRHIRVAAVFQEEPAALAGVAGGVRAGLIVVAPGLNDCGPEFSNPGALDRVGMDREKNRGGQSEQAGSIGDAGAMVAGAGGDDAGQGVALALAQQGVESTADFEGAGGRLVLELQVNVGAGHAAQGRRGYEAGGREIGAQQRARLLDHDKIHGNLKDLPGLRFVPIPRLYARRGRCRC